MAEIYVETLLRRVAGRPAVVTDADAPIGGDDFRARVYRYAGALDGLGIGRGDLVALYAAIRADGLAVRYAAHLLGAATCYLPAPSAERRRAELIARLEPTLLVAFAETAHRVPDGVTVPTASIGGGVPGPRLDELAAAASAEPLPCRARPDDLAVIAASGGTTGTPKGSTRSFARYAALVATREDPRRRQLVNAGFAYLSQTISDATLLGGGTLVIRPGFDAGDTLAVIERERITDLHVLEPQLAELVDHPDRMVRDLSSLRGLVHGGAAAPPTLRRRAWAGIGPVLGHGYGCSEVGFVLRQAPGEHDRPERFGTAGHVGPDVPLRVSGPGGEPTPTGRVGEIEARSPAMAQDYRTLPSHPPVPGPDGWYRTGDLGRIGDDGYLVVLGRAEDAIWRADEPLTPDLVAETACRVPGVGYAAVVPDEPSWIVAACPRAGDEAPDAAAVEKAVGDAYGADLGPVVVVPVDRIPTTEQGKPDRGAIRELVHATVSHAPSEDR